MEQLRTIACLTLFAMLTACGSNPPPDWWFEFIDADPDQLTMPFEESGKAIVIISGDVTFKLETIFLDEWRSSEARMVFEKKVPYYVVEDEKDQLKRYVVFQSDDPQAYVLEPGAYALVSHKSVDSRGARYRRPPSGWNRAVGRPLTGGFEVEAGEVLYLGHANLRYREFIRFTTEDKSEGISEALEDAFGGQYITLLDKVEMRPIQLRDILPRH